MAGSIISMCRYCSLLQEGELKDQPRTNQDLLEEISLLKQRIKELELSEAEHLRAMEALQRSEMKFRTLYDLTSDAVMLLDEKSFFDCNNATLKMFGCATREEFCGMHPADLSPLVQPCGTESRVLGDHHIVMALKNGMHQFEWVHRRADTGETFPADVLLSPMVIDGKMVLQAVVRDITQRKRIEEVLLKEMEFNSTLVESSPALFVAINADRTVRHMNDAMLRALGYTLKELKNKEYMSLVPESDREMLSGVFSTLIKRGQPTLNENRVLTKDGKEILVEWHGRAIKKPDGSPDYFFGVGTDITDRRRAEERIIASEAKYRRLHETMIDAYALVDMGGNIVEANRSYIDMLGYSMEELSGLAYLDLTPEKWHFFESKIIDEQIMVRGFSDVYEKEYIRKDGTVFPVELRTFLVKDDEGRPSGLWAIVRDITSRKRMEEELRIHRDSLGKLVAERTAALQEEVQRSREKEEQYLSLIESVKEWIWQTDANFVHTYLSPRIEDVLGYKPEELLGRSPADIMPPDEAERAMPLVRRTFSEKGPFVCFETIHTDKDGRLVFIEANGQPFFDGKGNLLGYRGSCNDVTERKRFIEALQERERELTAKSVSLEEVNAALRVLLKQREEDRQELEEKFVSNIREIILPYVHKMQKGPLDPKHAAYLNIVVTNLTEIMSPFLNTLKQFNFTPREIEVALHIKDGMTTKEMANLMGVAPSAIHSHRDNIRKKLGLNNKKINLRTRLFSLK